MADFPYYRQQPAVAAPMQDKYLKDIIGSKALYEAAEQAYNSGELDDEQMAAAAAQMDAAHNNAVRTRERAATLGLDTSNWGSLYGMGKANTANLGEEMNLADLRKLYQNRGDSQLNAMLTRQTPRDRETDVYAQARRSGLSRTQAARIAAEEAAPYQRAYAQDMAGALEQYGIRDGVITDLGMSVLGKLQEADPALAGVYANGYASPKSEYDSAVKEALAQIRKQGMLERAQLIANEAMRRTMYSQGEQNRRADNRNATTLKSASMKGSGKSGTDPELNRLKIIQDAAWKEYALAKNNGAGANELKPLYQEYSKAKDNYMAKLNGGTPSQSAGNDVAGLQEEVEFGDTADAMIKQNGNLTEAELKSAVAGLRDDDGNAYSTDVQNKLIRLYTKRQKAAKRG